MVFCSFLLIHVTGDTTSITFRHLCKLLNMVFFHTYFYAIGHRNSSYIHPVPYSARWHSIHFFPLGDRSRDHHDSRHLRIYPWILLLLLDDSPRWSKILLMSYAYRCILNNKKCISCHTWFLFVRFLKIFNSHILRLSITCLKYILN